MNIKNAIVLVDQIDIESQAGKQPLDAVISATVSRIVPVAMASGTDHFRYVATLVRRHVRWYGSYHHGWFAGSINIDTVRIAGSLLCYT